MHFVSLRVHRPTTPSQRWKRSFISLQAFTRPTKKHLLSFPWKAGRADQGYKTTQTQKALQFKKKIITPATLLRIKDIVAVCNFYFNMFNETPLVFCKTKKKGQFYLPATTTNQPGFLVYTFHKRLYAYQQAFAGLPIWLKKITYYMPFCFLINKPYKKYQYATASGMSCIKLRAPKKEKLLKVILPSKQIKYFSPTSLAIVGKVRQLWRHKRVVGKSGILRNRGVNVGVRGIAMNSVDHPHGGKANSNAPEKSPWGWVTKHGK